MMMAAAAVVGFLFTAAPAAADYGTCMEYCMKEHKFAYCHNTCTEVASDAGVVGGEDCSTDELKFDRIEGFIWEHYGPSGLSIYSADGPDQPGVFEVLFGPVDPERECEGQVKVTDDCRLTNLEGVVLSNARLRQQTLPCEE